MEKQTQRTDLRTQQGNERVRQITKVALTYIYIHTHTLPRVKDIASKKVLYNTRNPDWSLYELRVRMRGGELRGRGYIYIVTTDL